MRTLIAVALLGVLGSSAGAEKLRRLQFHHGPDGAVFFVRTETGREAPLFWGTRSQVLRPQPDGTSHLAGDVEVDIMRQALATWNAAARTCGDGIELSLGEPEVGEVGFDKVNRIVFRDDRWCAPIDCESFCGPADQCPGGEECHNPNAAGLTTVCFNAETGEILDADIELNGVNFSISADGASEVGGRVRADLANTFTHEVGHFIGLDHTCWVPEDGPQPTDDEGNLVPNCRDSSALTDEIRDATMFAFQADGETKKTSLEVDDIDGLCSIYPIDTESNCGCASTGAANDGGPVLCLIALIGLARRRRPEPPRRR